MYYLRFFAHALRAIINKLKWYFVFILLLNKSSLQTRHTSYRLSYAHKSFPSELGTHEVYPSGGGLKYYYLNNIWPHHSSGFDILYVVSSSHTKYIHNLMSCAKKRGAKIIWNQNGIHHPQDSKSIKLFIKDMERNIQFADYIIYQSKFCERSAKLFLNIPNVPSEVVYNAIDTNRFKPRKCGVLPDMKGKVTLLMAGSHYTNNKISVALRSLAIVSDQVDARLIVSGKISSALLPQIDENIHRYGLRNKVFFLGPYTQKQAVYIYNLGDIYLHTKYMDPCPSAVIEAMASGLPVVYSETGGTAELVGRYAGVGVPGYHDWSREMTIDADLIAEGIFRILSDYEAYSSSARQRAVERFDISYWLKKHATIFDQVLE
jgi:glycosyltransferase involved in cell wall biosynthesis